MTSRRLLLGGALALAAMAAGAATAAQLRSGPDAMATPSATSPPASLPTEPAAASPQPSPTPSPTPSTQPSPAVGWATAWPDGGAGPDCGGPHSYQAPTSSALFFTSTPTADGDGSNGRIPSSQMTALDWCQDSEGNRQWLRTDAAADLIRLNEAFRSEFGENIAIDMSYRSYEDQVAMREYYGSLAARPGTSNHGWGTAFDTWEWRAYAFGSERYEWLVANGPDYGWVAPTWARADGSNPEYWHFEYSG